MSRSRIEVRPLPRDWAPPGEAKHIWTIEHEGREWMLPAITEFVVELNRAEKVAVVRPIPGMISEEGTDADGR